MINMAFMPLYMREMWDVTPVTDARTHGRTVESRAVFSLSWSPAIKRHFIIKGEEKWLSIGMLSSGCQSIASHPGQIGQHKRQKQAWSHPRWTPFRKKKDLQCNEFEENKVFFGLSCKHMQSFFNSHQTFSWQWPAFIEDLNNLTLMKILTLVLLGSLVTFCWR